MGGGAAAALCGALEQCVRTVAVAPVFPAARGHPVTVDGAANVGGSRCVQRDTLYVSLSDEAFFRHVAGTGGSRQRQERDQKAAASANHERE